MIGPQTRCAVIGARGAVGREVVHLLESRGCRPLRLGRVESAEDGQRRLAERHLAGCDVVFLCAPAAVARQWAPRAVASGAVVVDNSSAYRLDPMTPLVIPEVNGAAIHRGHRLLANPNCSTILLLLAVAPLHRAFGCERVAVTTYQAVSGAGSAAMRELEVATRAALDGRDHAPKAFAEPVAFNCFSHDSAIDPYTLANGEELKIERECGRILGTKPGVTATCVRVPVMRAHCEAVTLTLSRPATVKSLRAELARAQGVVLVDQWERNDFPTSLKAAGRGEVLVGRLRLDRSQAWEESGDAPSGLGVHLFLAGDQLLKGAALNAVQIADLAIEMEVAAKEP